MIDAPLTAVSFAPLAVALPIFGAALAFILRRHKRSQRLVTIGVLVFTLALESWMLATVWNGGTYSVTLGGWAPPFGISMVVDGFSAFMLVVSTIVSLAVLLYATSQGMADGDEDGPVSIFHPAYLILVAGVSNAFLAGDLFNLYVGFEILLTASYVLLTLGGTNARIRAGTTYVVVSVASSLLFLISIAMIYAAAGTVNMADLAVKLPQVSEGTQMVLHVMLLVAFGIKAAVFPLSFWLPDSYPTAPAPVTAVFAGLLTKVGVYAIIRTETLLFPGNKLSTLLMVAAGLTMLVGILGAVAQTDIKRMLSFTLTSHIGFLIFGVSLGNQLGMAATIYYVAHHIVVQTSLFLVVGPDRTPRRHLEHRPAGFAGQDLPGACPALLHPGHEPRRHPAVLRLPGQAGTGPGRRRGRHAAGVDADRRLAAHLAADAAGRRPRVEQGVLAQGRGRHRPRPAAAGRRARCPRGDLRHRRRRTRKPLQRPRRHRAASQRHGRHDRGAGPGGPGADGLRRPDLRVQRQGRGPDHGQRQLHRGSARINDGGPAMSPQQRLSDAKNESGKRQRATLRQELPLLVWMVLVWGALWQDFAPGNLVFGLLLSLIVVNLFQLPPVILSGRFNVLRALAFAVSFLWDVVRASFEVMFLAVFRGPKTKSAVVAVSLRTESDLMVTAVGHALTLVPGSFVVEVDRRSSTLYLHVLNVKDQAGVEKARADVLDLEAKLIRMMGSKDELAALNAESNEAATGKEGTP